MPWQTAVTVQLQAGNTIINPNGLFTYSGAPALGNLIFSDASPGGTDQFGNVYQSGAAAYVTISGQTYAIRLGLGDFAGSSEPALFVHNQTSPPSSDPSFSGTGAPTNCTAIMYSGRSTVTSTGAGVQATDDTGSGVAGGEVTIVGGTCIVQGTLNAQGNVTVGGVLTITNANSLVTGDVNMNPLMAAPPNAAAVAAGTATLVQTEAFCSSLYNSMKNRGMFA